MDASIIILTKNAGQNFVSLLQHILTQKFDGLYEVIVIDSGSTDNTLRTAKEFSVKITQIKPEAFHHGKTRNLGAELSQGSILVYITQDALPLKNDWLQKLANGFEDRNVAMVCGRQIPWESTKPPEKFFYIYYFPTTKIVLAPGTSNVYRDNVFISNVNSATRKDVWQQFRFSESITMVEDKEFAKRILSAGWKIIYEPDAAVYHGHDFSLRSAFERYIDYGISYSQGAKGLPRSGGSAIGKASRYLAEELKYLESNGYLKWLPYSLLYEASKWLGSSLGQIMGKMYSKSDGNSPCKAH
jgi:rhamnosyltransferase